MNDAIVISIFMAAEGLHAYSAFLPSVFTIKTFVQDESGVKMIREGEVMASLFLLVLAATTSHLTKSKWPFLLAILAGIGMIGVYEFALARSPAREGCGCDE